MDRIVVLGAGRIGRRVAGLLAGRAAALVLDHDTAKLDLARAEGLATETLQPGVPREALRRALSGAAALIVVDPVLPVGDLVRLCIESGCHYLDLLESDADLRKVAEAAVGAPGGLCFAPGCGLAPGYVTALIAEEIAQAPPEAEITAFVGVLPLCPANRLGYANIWGVSGLVQEYTRPALGLHEGTLHAYEPLGAPETISLDGLTFEAFATAGSIDALARANEGAVRSLVFKTLRYPGHRDYMLFLLDDLGLRHQLHRLSSLLMTALPATEADRVVIALRRVNAPGTRPKWRSWHHGAVVEGGQMHSAMATLAAAHAIAMLDHIRGGAGQGSGPVLLPGSVPLDALRASPAFALLDTGASMEALPA